MVVLLLFTCYVVHTMPPSTHISSVVGILLIIMRLIWHGLNNHLPASDWHSHKKGWVGLGEQMVTFHMTKLINQHAGTQVQRRRAAPHHLFHHLQGTNTWAPIVAPWGSACSSVLLCQGWWHQNFPSALPQDAEKNEEKNTVYKICANRSAWERLYKWRQSQGLPHFSLGLRW